MRYEIDEDEEELISIYDINDDELKEIRNIAKSFDQRLGISEESVKASIYALIEWLNQNEKILTMESPKLKRKH